MSKIPKYCETGYDDYGERTITIGAFTEDKVCCECGGDDFHLNISVSNDDWHFHDIWCDECEKPIDDIVSPEEYLDSVKEHHDTVSIKKINKQKEVA